MKKFMLKIYYRNGDYRKSEYFETLQELHNRYKDLTGGKWASHNPTAWENVGNNWKRIMGY